MAKVLKYKYLCGEVNRGTEDNPDIEPIVLNKSIPYTESNEEIAKLEAYNGEYTVEDDGTEAGPNATKLDRIEAQVFYTAMMTDTLMEESI